MLQWGRGDLGAALALAHGQELLAHTYHSPETVERVVMGVLIVGFPIAVALAWYHGHKGLTSISAGELGVVSILLVIGAGLLSVLVRTRSEHSAPAEPVASATSAGAQSTVRSTRIASASRSRGPIPSATKPRLAILPFENLSSDPTNAFFTEGLQEEIRTLLANSAPDLEVISRTTMMSYRGRPVTVAQIARDLGVTRVLEGSVRREGNHVRLTLQLIDARTDEHLWAQDFDRRLVSAIPLQSDVATGVARQLAVPRIQRLNTEPEAQMRQTRATIDGPPSHSVVEIGSGSREIGAIPRRPLGTAIASRSGRTLEYPPLLIDDEAQPPILVTEREAEAACVLADALFAASRERAGAQGIEHPCGLEPQIFGDDRGIDADCPFGKFELDPVHRSILRIRPIPHTRTRLRHRAATW